ncbi:MAG: hypothetical protein AAB152_07235 [Candidatus Coatesbacteria bacterium]
MRGARNLTVALVLLGCSVAAGVAFAAGDTGTPPVNPQPERIYMQLGSAAAEPAADCTGSTAEGVMRELNAALGSGYPEQIARPWRARELEAFVLATARPAGSHAYRIVGYHQGTSTGSVESFAPTLLLIVSPDLIRGVQRRSGGRRAASYLRSAALSLTYELKTWPEGAVFARGTVHREISESASVPVNLRAWLAARPAPSARMAGDLARRLDHDLKGRNGPGAAPASPDATGQVPFARRILVADLDNASTNVEAAGLLRAAIEESLRARGYTVVPDPERIERFRAAGISEAGQWNGLSTEARVRLLDHDLLMLGRIEQYRIVNMGFYRRREVCLGLALVDASGDVVWKGSGMGVREVIFNPSLSGREFLRGLAQATGEKILHRYLKWEANEAVAAALASFPAKPAEIPEAGEAFGDEYEGEKEGYLSLNFGSLSRFGATSEVGGVRLDANHNASRVYLRGRSTNLAAAIWSARRSLTGITLDLGIQEVSRQGLRWMGAPAAGSTVGADWTFRGSLLVARCVAPLGMRRFNFLPYVGPGIDIIGEEVSLRRPTGDTTLKRWYGVGLSANAGVDWSVLEVIGQPYWLRTAVRYEVLTTGVVRPGDLSLVVGFGAHLNIRVLNDEEE